MAPRKPPADVWLADIDDTRTIDDPPTPAAPEPTPATNTIDMPPGPIQFELRIDNRIHFVQRVYGYSIDQTHPNYTTITAHLIPADARND